MRGTEKEAVGLSSGWAAVTTTVVSCLVSLSLFFLWKNTNQHKHSGWRYLHCTTIASGSSGTPRGAEGIKHVANARNILKERDEIKQLRIRPVIEPRADGDSILGREHVRRRSIVNNYGFANVATHSSHVLQSQGEKTVLTGVQGNQ